MEENVCVAIHKNEGHMCLRQSVYGGTQQGGNRREPFTDLVMLFRWK